MQIKELVLSKILIHYDTMTPVILAVGVLSHGLSVVISHESTDGSDRPIAYASRNFIFS